MVGSGKIFGREMMPLLYQAVGFIQTVHAVPVSQVLAEDKINQQTKQVM